MKYLFNEDFILRFEFFGGLLYSKFGLGIYIVEYSNAIFLDCIKNNYSYDIAIEIVKKTIGYDYEPDLNNMIEWKIILSTNESIQKSDIDIASKILEYKSIIDKCNRKKYLSAPIEVSIYPSSLCQLDCSFCYFKIKRNCFKKFLPASKWINLIDELNANNVIYLSILGGEPTLYPYIDEILNHVDKIKMKTTITTNGLNIKDSTFDIICNSKYITPTISIQSLDYYNDEYMGVSSDKIIDTIKKFLQNGKTPRINSVLYNQTTEEIYRMIDFCNDNNITEYALNAYMPLGNKLSINHNFDYYKELNGKIQNYLIKKEYNELDVSIQGCLLYSSYYSEYDNPVESEFDKLIYGCEAGKTKAEIMPNGIMLPCTAFSLNDFEYDNVFEKGFFEIWNNSKYLTLLRNYKTKDARCIKCKYNNFCNGGCPAYNLRKNKSLDERGDNRCQVVL